MHFDYFYGRQAVQFAFYQIPKLLITDDRFAMISTDGKILYSLILDRAGLSTSNRWLDDGRRVYIVNTLEPIMPDMHCANQEATKMMKELEEKVGLIEQKKQCQNHTVIRLILTKLRITRPILSIKVMMALHLQQILKSKGLMDVIRTAVNRSSQIA